MAQIAQQDHLVIDCGTSFLEPTDEAKGKLRKAYLRGTLLDCVLVIKNEDEHSMAKVIEVMKYTDNTLSVRHNALDSIDCGAFQPEDYTDDVPYDGE